LRYQYAKTRGYKFLEQVEKVSSDLVQLRHAQTARYGSADSHGGLSKVLTRDYVSYGAVDSSQPVWRNIRADVNDEAVGRDSAIDQSPHGYDERVRRKSC
jgi:hypothetical protein